MDSFSIYRKRMNFTMFLPTNKQFKSKVANATGKIYLKNTAGCSKFLISCLLRKSIVN